MRDITISEPTRRARHDRISRRLLKSMNPPSDGATAVKHLRNRRGKKGSRW